MLSKQALMSVSEGAIYKDCNGSILVHTVIRDRKGPRGTDTKLILILKTRMRII